MSAATLPGAPGPGAPDPDQVVARARQVLEDNWRSPGFCIPNPSRYPWQWLWDSCFHAVCWCRLGEPERALSELRNALQAQAADGFVPHMTYWSASGRADDPTHAEFWGRPATSAITQPPMYGHAVAELVRAGVDVPPDLVDQARRGLAFLLEIRGQAGRGPVIVHPWESGCDDSPRWDAWAGGSWGPDRWKQVKGELVAALRFDGAAGSGSPVASSSFEVAPAGFGALVAFNAAELASVTDDGGLALAAEATAARIDERWSSAGRTWSDDVLTGPGAGAPAERGGVRVVEALLPVLVTDDEDAVRAAFADVLDDRAFGGAFGPAGVHRDEPAYDPRTYWRGPAWPQLTYLMWIAARRRGHPVAAGLRDRLVAGAWRSGFAEYWDPDTGEAGGAAPQSWTALAAVVAWT